MMVARRGLSVMPQGVVWLPIQTVAAVSIACHTGQGYYRTTLQARQAKIVTGDIFGA